MTTLKTIKLTILTSAITLLILAYPTYRIMDNCHPDCTPSFTHPAMISLGSDDPRPDSTPQPKRKEHDYGSFFGLPTLTPHQPANR